LSDSKIIALFISFQTPAQLILALEITITMFLLHGKDRHKKVRKIREIKRKLSLDDESKHRFY
jgi:hypothetical protein